LFLDRWTMSSTRKTEVRKVDQLHAPAKIS
jgi:hypothetical protein